MLSSGLRRTSVPCVSREVVQRPRGGHGAAVGLSRARGLAVLLVIGATSATALAQGSADGRTGGGATADAQGNQQVGEQQAPEAAAPQPRFVDHLVVTATRSERPIEKLPVSATVIGREEVAAAPAVAVDDLLRGVAGVSLARGSSLVQYPNRNTVSMRGLGGTRALVLLDGIPLNDPVAGYVQWNRVPLESVEQIEIVRGGGASLFGNYALGGTINIITRPPVAGETRVDGSFGTHDTRRLAVATGQSLGERVTIGVAANAYDTDGYQRVEDGQRGAVDIPEWARAVGAQVRAEIGSPSGVRSFVRAGYFRNDLSLGTRLGTSDGHLYNLAAGSTVALRSGGVLTGSAFYQQQIAAVFTSSLLPGSGRDAEYRSTQQRTPVRDLGGSLQWSTAPSSRFPFVSAGLDVRRIAASGEGEEYDSVGRPVRPLDSGGAQTSAGLFGEVSYFPGVALEVLASARIDYWRNSGGWESPAFGRVTGYPARERFTLDPRLSVRYELSRSAALRAAVYRAFRAPNLRELYRSTFSKTYRVEPNPRLGPETLLGGEIGLDLAAGPVRGQVNVFRNVVDGLAGRVVLSYAPDLTFQTVNIGSARSQGFEAMAEIALARNWKVALSYTRADAIALENPPDPSLEGRWLPDVSRHSASLTVSRWSGSGVRLSARGWYRSRQFTDAANQIPVDAATVLDLFAAVPVGECLEAYLLAENVLDERYVADAKVGEQLGAPRQVSFGLRIRLSSLSPPGRPRPGR
jgi:outer membrane cobalamin receptor